MVKGRQFSWSGLVSLSRIWHSYNMWITWFWMVLLVYIAFCLAESRWFCNILSHFANSCSVAMKFPLLVSSTKKSSLLWWPLKGRACFAKNFTAFVLVCLLLSLSLSLISLTSTLSLELLKFLRERSALSVECQCIWVCSWHTRTLSF